MTQSRAQHYAHLDSQAARIAPGSEGVCFFPYLAGRGAPTIRRDARGAFAGLRLEHNQAHLYRALLEGVAFALLQIYRDLRRQFPAATVIPLSGGGAASPLWCQVLADVFATPTLATDEAVECRGAAMCLAVGLGWYADLDAARAMLPAGVSYLPDGDAVSRFEDAYPRWAELANSVC
jgi:sugar (pentulose or hexulose) kinase